MLPDPKIKCPYVAFSRSCRDIVAECDCPKFVNVRGRDPQTNTTVDRWGCADAFVPLLMVENVMAANQTGAAVESLRNEIMKAQDAAMSVRQEAVRRLTGT